MSMCLQSCCFIGNLMHTYKPSGILSSRHYTSYVNGSILWCSQAVELFLDNKIKYLEIASAVEGACDAHRQELVEQPSLDEIVHYDSWARQHVASQWGAREPAMA